MKKRVLVLLSALTFFPINAYAQINPEVEKTLYAIRPEAIKADMSFLADDMLEG